MDSSTSNTGYILNIPSTTNYWLLRAEGGKYLDDFEQNGFISIGHNKITMAEINNPASPKDVIGRTDIKQLYSKYYPSESKQAMTLRSNQLIEFVYVFNIGDIVIVPGKQSNTYSLGVIASDVYDEPDKKINDKKSLKVQNGIAYVLCPYIKRRKVLWIKSIKRSQLPKELSFALNAQQTVFKIGEAHNAINKLISPIFIDSQGTNIVIATNVANGLTQAQLVSISSFIQYVVNNNYKNIKIDIDKNSPTAITTILGSINDPETVKVFMSILKTLYKLNSTPVNAVATIFTIRQVLMFIFGTDIKKIGILKYFLQLKSFSLDNKFKKQQLKMIEEKNNNLPPDVKKDFASMQPKLKFTGTEISPVETFHQDEQRKKESKTKPTVATNSTENMGNQKKEK